MKHMKLPKEPARGLELASKAGLSDKERKIFIEHSYPQRRVIVIEDRPKTFRELADELHMTPQGIAWFYNRAMKKIEKTVRDLPISD